MVNKPSSYIPIPPDKYTGKQVILNSDRLLFNAKTDTIFLLSKQAISLSTKGTLNFDSDNICIINSPKIQLGLNATEPLLLGNKTVDLLKQLLDKLNILSSALGKAKIVVGDIDVAFTEINTPAQDLNLTVKNILSNLESIKSKQNFTL